MDQKQRDANSTTLMLIVVIGVFLAVEIPLSVLTSLHIISSRWERELNTAEHFPQFFRFPKLRPGQQHHPLHQHHDQHVLPPQLCHLLWHVQVHHQNCLQVQFSSQTIPENFPTSFRLSPGGRPGEDWDHRARTEGHCCPGCRQDKVTNKGQTPVWLRPLLNISTPRVSMTAITGVSTTGSAESEGVTNL